MFNQIVVVDNTGMHDWAIERLGELSEKPMIKFDDFPGNNVEIIQRIEDADCVFVSYKTRLDKEVLSKCKQLKYIGMCCSLFNSKSANVDIDFANENGITVTGIRDYGDEGLVEFIVSELIRLLKGLGNLQWKSEPVELTLRKIGIIGLGTTGKMLADRLQAFGAEIFYFSRTRKPEAEKEGIRYLPLDELLTTAEIVSLHLPRHTELLKEVEFENLGSGKILVNTSLGLTFSKQAFKKWISDKQNFAIFDGDGAGGFKNEFDKYENVISTEVVSGRTKEAYARLSQKVISNVEVFIEYHKR
jgi:lactate dehydrogenase-like 2-hydroxyacid dehydrogenase